MYGASLQCERNRLTSQVGCASKCKHPVSFGAKFKNGISRIGYPLFIPIFDMYFYVFMFSLYTYPRVVFKLPYNWTNRAAGHTGRLDKWTAGRLADIVQDI